MSQTDDPAATGSDERIYEEYVFGVRIVERDEGGDARYRFEAPDHVGATFDDPEMATLYADVYFDVNGFVEEDTGERGVPPEVIQGGKDTLAAYLLTRPWADKHWVASYFGVAPPYLEKYLTWVRDRAEEIRTEAAERGVEPAQS